ncbi:MAG: hypothetical protein ACR5LG_08620 [Sodalis sp. (in: enterobacteria)]|uniref:hypothetical protein n=1 Tax=Sodalis sp. (in: enterobacteria) TaxID=1898979 RepID=UPI003F401B18
MPRPADKCGTRRLTLFRLIKKRNRQQAVPNNLIKTAYPSGHFGGEIDFSFLNAFAHFKTDKVIDFGTVFAQQLTVVVN